MVQLAWLLVFVAVGGVSAATAASDETHNGDHPSFSVLIQNGKSICAGAIIDKYNIITSTNCAPRMKHAWIVGKPIIVVTNAQTILAKSSDKYLVKETYSQNHFIDPSKYPFLSGVAILQLVKPIKLEGKVRSIQFHEGEVPINKKIEMVGWNFKNRETGNISENFMKVTLSVIDHKDCQQYHKKQLRDTEFCTQPEAGNEFCEGYSGNPLIYEGKLVGLTTYGISCGESPIPDVQSNAESMSEYFNEIVNN